MEDFRRPQQATSWSFQQLIHRSTKNPMFFFPKKTWSKNDDEQTLRLIKETHQTKKNVVVWSPFQQQMMGNLEVSDLYFWHMGQVILICYNPEV